MALEIVGLKKNYGDFSVSLDLSVNEGETLVLAGPSGSGKTTALNLIAGISAPDCGKIFLDGEDISATVPWKRNVSMVFQDMSLFPHLDAGGNIAYGLVIRKFRRKERLRIVDETLEMVRLPGYAKRKIHTLSGGERQRVAIARALAVSPGVLLMDEPFSSLDLPLRKQLRAEFLEIRSRSKAPCVFVTHDREEAMTLGDKLALMKDGRIVESGTARELYLSPKTEFAASFFGAGRVLPCKITRRAVGEGGGTEVLTALGAMTVPVSEETLPSENEWVKLFIPHDALSIAETPPVPGRKTFSAICKSSFFNGQSLVVKLSLPAPDAAEIEITASPRTIVPASGSMVTFSVDESLLRFVADG